MIDSLLNFQPYNLNYMDVKALQIDDRLRKGYIPIRLRKIEINITENAN